MATISLSSSQNTIGPDTPQKAWRKQLRFLTMYSVIRQVRQRLKQEAQIRLGRNVRQLRQRSGMTQEQLGERSGLAPRHVQKIEGGETNATLETLAALALALEVDIAVLLGNQTGIVADDKEICE